MISLLRTSSENTDFQLLVKELDKELAIRDGDDHSFYAQFNKIVALKNVVVAYENNIAIGCGAIKPFDTGTMEIKRMYGPLNKRGQGIASLLLNALETWCLELNCKRCVLETGKNQPEAIRLYQKNHYQSIPNFGQYKHIANSICFEKLLKED